MGVAVKCAYVVLSLVVLATVVVSYYIPDEYADAASASEVSTDKRGGMKPVPFPCNGYDHVPRCLHGGKGPRKTWTKSGRFCVCLCPSRWVGPECGYAADSFPGKRSDNLSRLPWDLRMYEE